MKLPTGAVLSLFTDCGLTLNSSLLQVYGLERGVAWDPT